MKKIVIHWSDGDAYTIQEPSDEFSKTIKTWFNSKIDVFIFGTENGRVLIHRDHIRMIEFLENSQ